MGITIPKGLPYFLGADEVWISESTNTGPCPSCAAASHISVIRQQELKFMLTHCDQSGLCPLLKEELEQLRVLQVSSQLPKPELFFSQFPSPL